MKYKKNSDFEMKLVWSHTQYDYCFFLAKTLQAHQQKQKIKMISFGIKMKSQHAIYEVAATVQYFRW